MTTDSELYHHEHCKKLISECGICQQVENPDEDEEEEEEEEIPSYIGQKEDMD